MRVKAKVQAQAEVKAEGDPRTFQLAPPDQPHLLKPYIATIKFSPHPGQALVQKSKARFRIVIAGAKWGKTTLGIAEAIRYAGRPNTLIWWVAPYFDTVRIAVREFERICPKVLAKVHGRDMFNQTARFINGSEIWFKSADNPASLLGVGLDLVVLDEAARIKQNTWEAYIRPRLSDPKRLGHALIISTPKGYNWIYELFLKGKRGEPGYESWNFASRENPFFREEEWEQAKRDLPYRIFLQEYEGKFISDLGGLFSNPAENAVEPGLRPPEDGKVYFMGVDIGRKVDYSVISILDEEGRLVFFDRFQETWPRTVERIVETAKRYNNAFVLIDSTVLGDPVFEFIYQRYENIEGYSIQASTKGRLFDNLRILLSQHEITYPEIPELIEELNVFGTVQSETGRLRYEAPKGFHDDCVVSLALAAWLWKAKPVRLAGGIVSF